jgi:hypothetical protein
MSLWQFQAAVNGYLEAHAPADDKSLGRDEIEALGNYIDGK